jgi:sugar phosphate permease
VTARAESGLLGPLQGWLTDRLGPRALIRTGMVIFAAGFVLFSQVGSLLTFFAAFFLMALGSSLGGYLPIGVAIVAWFRRRRALALSISATGSAIGGLLTPLVVLALTGLGWRWTAFLSGLLVLGAGLPLAQLIRHRPEFHGLRPDGDLPEPAPDPGRPDRAAPPARPGRDFTVREAVRTRAFWYVSLGHGAALLVVSAVLVHMVVHVTERLGYSLTQAASVVALMTTIQIVGHVGGGWAGDRYSKRMIAAGCMLGHAAALALLAFASAFWMVLAFAVLHGLAWGARGPLMAAIRADYFGSAAYGTITGVSSTIVMFGMMAGRSWPGWWPTPPGATRWDSRSWPLWPRWGRSSSRSRAAPAPRAPRPPDGGPRGRRGARHRDGAPPGKLGGATGARVRSG